MDPAAGSSSEPILVENIPAQENLVDNQVAQLPEDNQGQQSSSSKCQCSAPGEEEA
jgi:hypothetical protein